MIKIGNFNLEVYDKYKHFVLVKNLNRDEGVCNYVSGRFEKWLDKLSEKNEKYISYAIVRDNKYVGMVGILDITRDNFVELWCAIKKEERHKGNAEELLGEMVDYFKEEFSGIKLKINKGNIYSIKSALNNGFVLVGKESKDIETYYYSNDIKNKER